MAVHDAAMHTLGVGTTPDMKPVVYFQHLAAPLKGFYTFEQSAHRSCFEEPEKMRRILREDVLGRTNRLADAIVPQ